MIAGDLLTCINVGDSRAIMGTYADLSASKLSVIELSHDHKPNLKAEYERILKCNGRVDSYRDANGNPMGPSRVWRRTTNIPGLAMSRSFGDRVAHEVGVIATPDVKELRITERDKVVVIASDGVWELLSNERVLETVSGFLAHGSPELACEAVAKEAVAAWSKLGATVDDITVLVIFLDT